MQVTVPINKKHTNCYFDKHQKRGKLIATGAESTHRNHCAKILSSKSGWTGATNELFYPLMKKANAEETRNRKLVYS